MVMFHSYVKLQEAILHGYHMHCVYRHRMMNDTFMFAMFTYRYGISWDILNILI